MTETDSSGRADGVPPPRRAEDFDGAYAGTPPWDIGRPQPAFLALAEAEKLVGPVLDVERRQLLDAERTAEPAAELQHDLVDNALQRDSIPGIGLREASQAVLPQADQRFKADRGRAHDAPPWPSGVSVRRAP